MKSSFPRFIFFFPLLSSKIQCSSFFPLPFSFSVSLPLFLSLSDHFFAVEKNNRSRKREMEWKYMYKWQLYKWSLFLSSFLPLFPSFLFLSSISFHLASLPPSFSLSPSLLSFQSQHSDYRSFFFFPWMNKWLEKEERSFYPEKEERNCNMKILPEWGTSVEKKTDTHFSLTAKGIRFSPFRIQQRERERIREWETQRVRGKGKERRTDINSDETRLIRQSSDWKEKNDSQEGHIRKSIQCISNGLSQEKEEEEEEEEGKMKEERQKCVGSELGGRKERRRK